MALGKVSVNNLNLGQGAVTEIERYFIFIGIGAKSVGQFIPLDTQSDLDTLLGTASSSLKTQVAAAKANGGSRWACVAAPIAAVSDWSTALDKAQLAGYSVEGVVITDVVTAAASLTAMHSKAIELSNTYGRRLFILAATAGIQAAQSWAQYVTAQKAIVASVSAPRVCVVPLLHGNDLGVLAGRLANVEASIADSPMRVATGAVLGLGTVPTDSTGAALTSAVRGELDTARLSVTQTYPDYPGVFFGDANMLDAPGSDYLVIENLRLVDKAARAVRLLLIKMVADRRVNSTANSMASATSRLMKPLRDMSKSTTFAGQVFPGEIQPPVDGDIVLSWSSKTKVEAYIKLRPYDCPKDLTGNIALDLSTE